MQVERAVAVGAGRPYIDPQTAPIKQMVQPPLPRNENEILDESR